MRRAAGRCVAVVVVAAPALSTAQPSLPQPLPAAIETIGEEFTRILGVRRLSDGRVLVSDVGGERVLLVVDRPGVAPRPVSRTGRGPGEYGRPGWLAAVGRDSTVMDDFQDGRRHLIVGTTIVGEAHRVSRRAAEYRLVGAASDGSFAEITPLRLARDANGRALAPMRRYADSLVLLRYRPNGAVDTLARLRGGFQGTREVRKVMRSGGAMTYVLESPVASEEQAWMFPDGWTALLRKDPYRVDWLTPSGQLRLGPSLPFEALPLNAAQRRAAIRHKHYGEDGDDFSDSDFPPWPSHMPAFLSESLTPLADGSVLIRRAPDARIDGVRHDIVDRDGQLRQVVMLAAGQRVVGADARGIFVATTSDEGFEVLALHPIPSRR